MYTKDIEELIKERHSTRKYSDKMIDDTMKKQLLDYCRQFESEHYRFNIVDYNYFGKEKLSTYGLIRNAKIYLVAIGKRYISHDLSIAVDFGYDFEHIILKATEMGISTCWMGMSYNEKKLKDKVGVNDDESIIMATPLGYKEEVDTIERLGRMVMKADKRLPETKLFFENMFDTSITNYLHPKYKNVLDMVRLAPSAGNAQPWRVVQVDDGYDFYVRSRKFYDKMKNKRIDFAFNDMGITKMHFESVANKYNLKGHWITREKSPIQEEVYAFSWKIKEEN